MGDHEQVPPIVQQIARVADDVAVGAVLAGQQVARPSVVAERQKGVPHNAAILAGDEHPHGPP